MGIQQSVNATPKAPTFGDRGSRRHEAEHATGGVEERGHGCELLRGDGSQEESHCITLRNVGVPVSRRQDPFRLLSLVAQHAARKRAWHGFRAFRQKKLSNFGAFGEQGSQRLYELLWEMLRPLEFCYLGVTANWHFCFLRNIRLPRLD
jgi:hypothetical protein